MEIYLKFFSFLLQCNSKLKWNIIFYSVFTLLFLFFVFSFIILSPSLSPHCLSIFSFFLHKPTNPSFFLRDPSPICTSPAATNPSLSTHVQPPTWPISASILYFQRFSFVFQAVFVFRLCVSGFLVFQVGWICVSGTGFGVWFWRLGNWIWV